MGDATLNPTRLDTAFAVAASPTFVASVVLLIANDHWLKGRYPGLVTGKASDAAALILASLVVALVVVVAPVVSARRVLPWLPVLAPIAPVGLFVALQIDPTADAWFEHATGGLIDAAGWVADRFGVSVQLGRSVNTRDVTDLVMVPAVLVASFEIHRVVSANPSAPSSSRSEN
ncbi:MAG: hypothetical protein AAF467_07195 [Actinomycetota bacterium]